MLSLTSIQATVRSAIAAHAYFSGVSVIADDGRQDPAIETELTTKGFVVVVCPILGAKAVSQAGGRLLLVSEIVVRVMESPEVNAANGGAQKGTTAAIAAVCAAVLGWRPAGGLPGTSEKLFEAAPDFLAITNYDPGLIIYDLNFQKHTTPT
jgi:hypothetical protein